MGNFRASNIGNGVFKPDGQLAFQCYENTEAMAAAKLLNQLLSDVRVLQAAGIELANATVGMAWRMEVNELIGKTDILGVSDQKAYDAAKAAHAKFVEVSGALTRWGGGGKE